MLGQEIIIYSCLLDHYNNPAEVTQFRIIGEITLFMVQILHQYHVIMQLKAYV